MRLIDADAILEPIADCEERETCDGCPCRILDCEDFERVLKAAPTVEPTNKVIAEVKVDTDEIIERLKETPLMLVQNEPPWIPVAERLPEKQGYYFVTHEWRSEKFKDYEIGIDWFRNGEWVETPRNYKVIAWMPLPEPYREESEDDH